MHIDEAKIGIDLRELRGRVRPSGPRSLERSLTALRSKLIRGGPGPLIVGEARIGERAERMAMWERKNEVLVTLPMEASVARFDADTLERNGNIPTVFGVRAIAVDKTRNLLFCGSIATGELELIDLVSGQQRASYYLGPWLRTIELLPQRGVAYVSSNGAIYEVTYK